MLPGYDVFGKSGFDLDPKVVESGIQRCAREHGIALCVGDWFAEKVFAFLGLYLFTTNTA